MYYTGGTEIPLFCLITSNKTSLFQCEAKVLIMLHYVKGAQLFSIYIDFVRHFLHPCFILCY